MVGGQGAKQLPRNQSTTKASLRAFLRDPDEHLAAMSKSDPGASQIHLGTSSPSGSYGPGQREQKGPYPYPPQFAKVYKTIYDQLAIL